MGPPPHFERSRNSSSVPKETLRSPHLSGRAAHVARARENIFPPAIKRVYHDNKAVRCDAVNMLWLMSRSRSDARRAHGERKDSRAHRTHRRPRRKERIPRPARETSGREACFLSMNGRGGAGRERWLPWQCANARVYRPILVKWKILDRN